MGVKYERVSVTVTGSAGSATGSASSRPLTGLLHAVHLAYTTQPATADVTIATAGTTTPAQTLLTRSDSATDGWFYPRKAMNSDVAGALTVYERAPMADAITVSVAQGNAGAVVATLVYLED